MPTYHYACEKCGNEFEIDQSISDPPRKRCPKCRGAVYRVIHPVGHILKGSGFYKTDYRSEDFGRKESDEKGKVVSDGPKPPDSKEKATPKKKKASSK